MQQAISLHPHHTCLGRRRRRVVAVVCAVALVAVHAAHYHVLQGPAAPRLWSRARAAARSLPGGARAASCTAGESSRAVMRRRPLSVRQTGAWRLLPCERCTHANAQLRCVRRGASVRSVRRRKACLVNSTRGSARSASICAMMLERSFSCLTPFVQCVIKLSRGLPPPLPTAFASLKPSQVKQTAPRMPRTS